MYGRGSSGSGANVSASLLNNARRTQSPRAVYPVWPTHYYIISREVTRRGDGVNSILGLKQIRLNAEAQRAQRGAEEIRFQISNLRYQGSSLCESPRPLRLRVELQRARYSRTNR